MSDQGWFVMKRLVDERNALLEFYQDAMVRSAFRALAEIGLAVAAGALLLAADNIALLLGAPSRHGPVTRHRLQRLNFAKDTILGRDRSAP